MILWKKIFIALALGALLGVILNQTGNESIAEAIKPIGTIFVNAIKMLIVSLIFVSLVTGMTAMSDLGKIGRVGGKAVGLYLLTTAIAITIGLVLGVLLQPGVGIDRILDMARTSLNVVGDCAVSVVIAKSEGEIDQKAYDTPHVMDDVDLAA